jgi:hypothetical protein
MNAVVRPPVAMNAMPAGWCRWWTDVIEAASSERRTLL